MKTNRRPLNGDHNQCPSCSEYFNSSYAFAVHKTGTVGKPDRRCMTPDEMRASGMAKNSQDWWVSCLRSAGAEISTDPAEQE